MAGIEKICELSGEYPGWEMRAFKRNHIQIMPHHRKKFRGAKATLTIEFDELRVYDRWRGGYSRACPWRLMDYDFAIDWFFEAEHHYEKQRFVVAYKYTLQVEDEHLQGEVQGKYVEWTTEIGSTVRRLKRMIGPGLVVVNNANSRKRFLREWGQKFIAKARELHERHNKAATPTTQAAQ